MARVSKFAKWSDRVDKVARMAAKGYTDAEIGKEFEVSGQMIYAVRAHHKIPANSRRGGYQKRGPAPEPEPLPELPVVNGVKQCPTRWLEGAGPGPTARPRR